jgi:23S rRNA (uracil1939-C5)-methyltransferase
MRPTEKPTRRSLRAGATLELAIEKGVYRGLGLGRHEGQVVFVPHTMPGETVRVRVERAGRGYVSARLIDVVAASSDRRVSPCPYAPRCGGCAHQEMDYAAQLRLKEAVLRDALARAGVPWEAPLPLVGSPEREWRTRAVLHVDHGPKGVRLGLFEEGSHRIVDLEACLQLSEGLNRAARGIVEALRTRPTSAGLVRGVELAESADGAQRVACLLVSGDLGTAAPLAALAGEIPWLTGLGVGHEERSGGFVLLAGDPHVEATVGGVTFRAHVRSFFQGNRHLVGPLAGAVTAAIPKGAEVLDLYSGVGLFALLAAPHAVQVRGAETSATAVDDAEFNKQRAAIANVTFERTDVATALARWPAQADECVILDPPRTGAGADVVRALGVRRPATLVYVSCDPPTLGRDLKGLLAQGYAIDSVRAFDLFPDTFHVETLVIVRRAA